MTDSIHSAAEPIPYRQEVFRKLIHLSSLWMVALIFFWPPERIYLFYIFLVLLILNLLCEFAYSLHAPVITPIYNFFFGRMLRGKVRPGQWVVSGSPPVFAAAALVCFCYYQFIGATALGVMLIADTAAALIGRRFGKHKINGKSWEGVFAFCVSGILFAWGMLALSGEMRLSLALAAVLGVILAAAAELYEKQIRVDDNLSIPLVFGFVVAVANKFF